MATADPANRPYWYRLALVVPVVAAAAFVFVRPTSGASVAEMPVMPSTPSTTEPTIDVAAASAYQFDSIEEMAAASDLVVLGGVVSAERGRLVGDPEAGGVVSRVLTLSVTDLVRDPSAINPTTVLVEEEGWLPDGTELVVNGVQASEEGDVGLWFLDQVIDGEVPTYVVINSQGRFLDSGGRVEGGDPTDALVRASEQRSFNELVDAAR